MEDFGVVVSAKPEAMASVPAVPLAPGTLPEPPRLPRRPVYVPMPPPQTRLPTRAPQYPTTYAPKAELTHVKPETFNIDFGPGVGTPSEQVGPAAAGQPGDLWNTVCIGFNDHHTASDLKFANGEPSPIEVEMSNLGGSWNTHGLMRVHSPMFDTYQYPTANKGGDSTVILHDVPPGKYNLYLYGHTDNPVYYGDYTLIVGDHKYGRKQTSHKIDAMTNTKWVEGSQYVKFSNVKVGSGEDVEILIQPSGLVTDPSGRTFRDAVICGLQLIPAK